VTHTAGASNSGGTGDIPNIVIAGIVLIALAAIGGVVYLTAIGRPVDNVIILIGALLTPTIASLLAVRHGSANSKKLDAIKDQVDGKIDNLISDKSKLEHQVTALGQEPITLPRGFHPLSNPTDTVPQKQVRNPENG
jgi:uncharacterized sodium:solute symporter family permease YidK